MTNIISSYCEPFRTWSRVEPRPRQQDFSQSLQAQVHDALWMLTRQWQFGEFQGEDTGSAIMAKMELEISRISKYQNTHGPAETYDEKVPLEARVERKCFKFDLLSRAQTGQQWLKFVEHFGAEYNRLNQNVPNPGQSYQPGAYKPLFIRYFPLPDPNADLTDGAGLSENARITSAKPAHQFLTAAASRSLDGVAIFKLISANRDNIAWPTGVVDGIVLDHRDWINQAAIAFRTWFLNLYFLPGDFNLPEKVQDQSWNSQMLEYQFACAIAESGGQETVLQADEYYHGSLDWYHFDINSKGFLGQPGTTLADTVPENRVISVIPTEARFGGMPAFRWWEFEDSSVNLGNIESDSTDLAKILLLEFALMYSNDWFLVPVKIPVGSLTRINGLVVTDVFGQRTVVEPAGREKSDDWSGWSLFNLAVIPNDSDLHSKADTRLFLPPVAVRVLESEPIEEVRFIRDETSNIVWAVETQIPDMLGQSQDGHKAGSQLRSLLEDRKLMITSSDEPPHNAILSYTFSNSVPENWIPFIPVHIPGQFRNIQLQRGSMPRILVQGIQPVRPNTLILRPGLNKDDSQSEPYFLHEEEISRAGLNVSSTFQRARWYNGRVVTWYGNRKVLGRGEGSSGLKFDIATPAGK